MDFVVVAADQPEVIVLKYKIEPWEHIKETRSRELKSIDKHSHQISMLHRKHQNMIFTGG